MSETLAKPEIVQGMSFGDYIDLPACNATTLLTYLNNSCEEALYEQTHDKEDTRALTVGHASHAALLTPDVFKALYVTRPAFGNPRTNAAKDERAKWETEHATAITISEGENEEACAIRDHVLSDEHIGPMFIDDPKSDTRKVAAEVTVLWTDEETGIPCKARIDLLALYHGYQVLADFKTARSLSDDLLRKAIADYSYHIRLAWYLEALNAVRKSDWRVMIVWARNHAPWSVRLTELSPDDLAEGAAVCRNLLNRHAKCVKDNYWPGYAKGAEEIGIPRWAFKFTAPKN